MKMDVYNIPFFNNGWALFFLKLGELFYKENIICGNQSKLNIAISIPFNDYITYTIGAGMAHALYLNDSSDDNFWLKDLKKGTLVFYSSPTESSTETSYIYNGLSDLGYPTLQGIGANSDMVVTLQKKESWKNIRVAPVQNNYKTQRNIEYDPSIEHLSRFYDKGISNKIFNRSIPLFYITANESQLRREAKLKLNKYLSLQDFVRIRKIGEGKQYSFVCDLLSKDENVISDGAPFIVDGANLYIRHRKELINEAKIIVLSRENPMDSNIDALEELEYEFITNNTEEDPETLEKLKEFHPPKNIEILCWRAFNE